MNANRQGDRETRRQGDKETRRQGEFAEGFANVYEDAGEVEIAGESEESLSRRQFLALSAASLSLAAVAGCRRPELEILPYTQTPDNVIPGVPHYYATSMPKPGGCSPILVESNEGRPTKIEGNPKHPASLGATDAHTQASIYDLYSPDRSKEVLRKDKDGKLVPKSWEEFDAFAAEHFGELRKNQGEGLRFLIEDDTSPALRLLREEMKQKFPKAIWHVYEPIDNANNYGRLGQPRVIYNFDAPCIVSLDCDFLGTEGNVVANSRGFAEGRANPADEHGTMPTARASRWQRAGFMRSKTITRSPARWPITACAFPQPTLSIMRSRWPRRLPGANCHSMFPDGQTGSRSRRVVQRRHPQRLDQ